MTPHVQEQLLDFAYGELPTGETRVGVVVNPVLEPVPSGERALEVDTEGCLSVLGQHAELARAEHAVVHGFDASGAPVTVEGYGLLARCLQHETDHLDGLLFIDRLGKRARKKVLDAWAATT